MSVIVRGRCPPPLVESHKQKKQLNSSNKPSTITLQALELLPSAFLGARVKLAPKPDSGVKITSHNGE